MDLKRTDTGRMRLVQDRSKRRVLVNTVITPGFLKSRIFHSQLSNYRLLAGDYAATELLYVRKNRNSLTSQCYVIGSTARYEDRQLSSARGIWCTG